MTTISGETYGETTSLMAPCSKYTPKFLAMQMFGIMAILLLETIGAIIVELMIRVVLVKTNLEVME